MKSGKRHGKQVELKMPNLQSVQLEEDDSPYKKTRKSMNNYGYKTPKSNGYQSSPQTYRPVPPKRHSLDAESQVLKSSLF